MNAVRPTRGGHERVSGHHAVRERAGIQPASNKPTPADREGGLVCPAALKVPLTQGGSNYSRLQPAVGRGNWGPGTPTAPSSPRHQGGCMGWTRGVAALASAAFAQLPPCGTKQPLTPKGPIRRAGAGGFAAGGTAGGPVSALPWAPGDPTTSREARRGEEPVRTEGPESAGAAGCRGGDRTSREGTLHHT
jgi:hypothetical protein